MQGETTTPSNQIFNSSVSLTSGWSIAIGITVTLKYLKFTGATGTNDSKPFFNLAGGAPAENNALYMDTCIINGMTITDGSRDSVFGFSDNNGHTGYILDVRNTLIYGITLSAASSMSLFIEGGSGNSGTINFVNNVIINNGTNPFTAIFSDSSGADTVTLTWKNNIIYSSTSIPFYSSANQFNTNNISHSCNYNITSVPAGTGNITSDPLFVDAPNNNFNLRQTSPCIGTGAP